VTGTDHRTAGTLAQSLIGSWELCSRVDLTPAGEPRTDPLLGADPFGLLIYDAAGNFAAQFMKRERSATEDPVPAVAARNNSRARGGYDAYFGRYSVDEASATVTQTLIGALSPEDVGQVITREMQVEGDLLVIRLETATVEGEPILRTLTWRRVG